MQVLCGLQGIFLLFNCQTPVKKQDFTLTNQIIQHIIIKNLTEQSDKSYEQK